MVFAEHGNVAMKRLEILYILLIFLCGLSPWVLAGNTATQTVTFEVKEINKMSVSGDPGGLLIEAATAGQQPDGTQDSSTSYAVTTNEANQKITARIDSDMPTGTILRINLAAPAGASSQGNVTLSRTATDVVTSVSRVAEGNLGITYIFNATEDSGVVPQQSRIVTFTLTNP